MLSFSELILLLTFVTVKQVQCDHRITELKEYFFLKSKFSELRNFEWSIISDKYSHHVYNLDECIDDLQLIQRNLKHSDEASLMCKS